MKRRLLLLTFFTCTWHLRIIAQSAATTDISGRAGEPNSSNGLVSELQEIGYLPLSLKPEKNPAIFLNILVRKSRFPGGNTVYKDIFFDGQTNDYQNNHSSGYIDESEIDDAIRALKYINDSLQVLKPAHKLTYEKSFTHSDLRIYAVFNPYKEDELAPLGLGTLGNWNVYVGPNNAGYPDFVHLNPGDVPGMIELFETAKEKLKML